MLNSSNSMNMSDSSMNLSKGPVNEGIMEFRSLLGSVTSNSTGVSQLGKTGFDKISNKQLLDILSKFRSGQVNVLIATNVIEEGLDVSECNLVICMNELLNVKAFIQMKGRARKEDSDFIFLCAD